MKANYIRSEVATTVKNALEMWFEYRGKQYSIIRSATYPENERKQHEREQWKIDAILDNKETQGIENAQDAINAFFELIEE